MAGERGRPCLSPPPRVLCPQILLFSNEGRTDGPTRRLRTPWLGFMWWGSRVVQAISSCRARPPAPT